MSYNGSGTFQINTSGQPVVTGTSISSTAFNALTADLATGLSTAITKDGQTTTTARIPFALGINSTLVTDATNTTSGSIITAGGVGIAKALYVGTTANVAGLTASSAVATDASKNLVSVTNTGTGNNVLATGPTISGPTISDGTANGVAYLNGSKVLTTGSALVFDGSSLGVGVTPSAIQTGYKAIQIGATVGGGVISAGTDTYFTNNAYVTGGTWYSGSTGYASYYNQSAGAHTWTISTTAGAAGAKTMSTQMTLNASGDLLVGTTVIDPSTNAFTFQPSSKYGVFSHETGTSSGTVFTYFSYAGSAIGSVSQNGTTGVLYNLTSDYRLKNDQQALTGAKDFIMALKPKKWQWWDGSGEGVGFVAHEFMEVAKHSGHGEKDAVDADGKPKYQSIQPSSSEVMANLVSFIQEQQALITTLTDRITALEARNG